MSHDTTSPDPDEPDVELPDGHPKDWPEETKREVLSAVSEMNVEFSEYARRMLQSLDADPPDAPESSGGTG